MNKTHQYVSETQPKQKKKPALTPEARENMLIAAAFDLVEQRLRDGTATAQEVVHFLKLGTARETLEKEKLEKENELIRAKISALESSKASEELYMNALNAMKAYSISMNDEEGQ